MESSETETETGRSCAAGYLRVLSFTRTNEKDLLFEARGIRTLVQSLDRRKSDQAEGGV
jgi:hypothetical protein